MLVFAQFLLYYIEGFCMIVSGVSIFNLPLRLKKINMISISHAFFTYLVRKIFYMYHIPFGTHSLIIWFALFIMIKYVLHLSWLQSMVCTLIGIGLLLFGEGVFLIPIMSFLGVNILTMSQSIKTILLATFLTDIPMVFVIIISRIIKKPVINIKELEEAEKW